MKPLKYWDDKLEAAKSRLGTLMGLAREDHIPQIPPRRVLRGRWAKAVTRWRAVQRRVLQRRHDIKKLQARILYFEERIALLTPTFWARLADD